MLSALLNKTFPSFLPSFLRALRPCQNDLLFLPRGGGGGIFAHVPGWDDVWPHLSDLIRTRTSTGRDVCKHYHEAVLSAANAMWWNISDKCCRCCLVLSCFSNTPVLIIIQLLRKVNIFGFKVRWFCVRCCVKMIETKTMDVIRLSKYGSFVVLDLKQYSNIVNCEMKWETAQESMSQTVFINVRITTKRWAN